MRLKVCLVLGSVLILASCGSSGGSTTSPSSTTSTTTTTTTPAASAVTVDIPSADYATGKTTTNFSPGSVTVAVGGTVTWTNNDIITHTSTSTQAGQTWNSEIAAGARFARVFPTAGSFDYRCTIHTGMSGTITVR
ncbi:MAG: hypothetical protein EPO35_11850 [Acidobacteria bacterium]|nr:MAG: hypothetical protein EPO35_11850 [Acidobacteriota bacterium]